MKNTSHLTFFTLIIFLFFKEIIVVQSLKNFKLKEEIIDLKTESELPSKDDKKFFYVPILHTNDLHGSFYPKNILLPSGKPYSIGGLEYLGKYASIMSKYWKNRLLYFDTGDQFQGGFEAYISNGKIIMDFLNELNVNKAVIGNHEFDYGIPFMKDYMNLSNFDWVIDNIKNKTSNEYLTFPNQEKTSLIDIEGYKIGIIGLSTDETLYTTITDVNDLVYEEYVNTINTESEKLRKEGANAVIVIAHIGLNCKEDSNKIKLEYKLRNINTKQGNCKETDEAYILLNKLKPGTIDLFLGGHKHDTNHNWINESPFMSNDKNGKYAQIVYLPFDRKTKKLVNKKIVIEGPLPICEKIFENRKICDLSILTEKDEKKYGRLYLPWNKN